MSKIDLEIAAFLEGTENSTSEPDQMISALDLGDWLGITARHCSKLARDGKLPRDSAGSFPVKAAVLAYCNHLREGSRGRPLADPELADERARLTSENADKVAIQNQKARGDLIPAVAVRAAWLGVVTDLRSRLFAVPSRVAARLGLDRATAAALDAEIRAVMADLSTDGADSPRDSANPPDFEAHGTDSPIRATRVAKNRLAPVEALL